MRKRMDQRSRAGWLVWFTWLLVVVIATAKGEFALVGIISFPFALAFYVLDTRDKARLMVRAGSVHRSAGR